MTIIEDAFRAKAPACYEADPSLFDAPIHPGLPLDERIVAIIDPVIQNISERFLKGAALPQIDLAPPSSEKTAQLAPRVYQILRVRFKEKIATEKDYENFSKFYLLFNTYEQQDILQQMQASGDGRKRLILWWNRPCFAKNRVFSQLINLDPSLLEVMSIETSELVENLRALSFHRLIKVIPLLESRLDADEILELIKHHVIKNPICCLQVVRDCPLPLKFELELRLIALEKCPLDTFLLLFKDGTLLFDQSVHETSLKRLIEASFKRFSIGAIVFPYLATTYDPKELFPFLAVFAKLALEYGEEQSLSGTKQMQLRATFLSMHFHLPRFVFDIRVYFEDLKRLCPHVPDEKWAWVEALLSHDSHPKIGKIYNALEQLESAFFAYLTKEKRDYFYFAFLPHILKKSPPEGSLECLNVLKELYASYDRYHEEDLPLHLMHFTHPKYNLGLDLDKLTKTLQDIYPDIRKGIWEGYLAFAKLPNNAAKLKAFDLSCLLILGRRYRLYNVPDFMRITVIPALARLRNIDYLDTLKHTLVWILPHGNLLLLDHLQELMTPDPSRPPQRHLIAPMVAISRLLPNYPENEPMLRLYQERLQTLRHDLRNTENGLDQAIGFLAHTLSFYPQLFVHLNHALLGHTADDIKQSIFMLEFIFSIGGAKLLETWAPSWTKDEIEEKMLALWSEKFGIDTTRIPDFTNRFFQLFHGPRFSANLEQYAASHNEEMRKVIGSFVMSVLDGTFHEKRYDPSASVHLTTIAKDYPEVYAKWQEAGEPFPLSDSGEVGKLNVETVQHVIKTALGDEHMTQGDISSPTIAPLIAQLTSKAPSLATLTALKEALTTYNPDLEFINDVQGLITRMQAKAPKAGLSCVDTDCPISLFLCGSEVPGSCQRTDGSAQLNVGLMGYLQDGKHRMLAVIDHTGKTIARCIIRLMLRPDGRPALFIERQYGDGRKVISDSLLARAKEKAEYMGVPLYKKSLSSKDSPLKSLGGVTTEYVDGAGGIQNGPYTIYAEPIHLTVD